MAGLAVPGSGWSKLALIWLGAASPVLPWRSPSLAEPDGFAGLWFWPRPGFGIGLNELARASSEGPVLDWPDRIVVVAGLTFANSGIPGPSWPTSESSVKPVIA